MAYIRGDCLYYGCSVTMQRATAEAERLRADKDALETQIAERSVDTSLCSMRAAKAEQDLISNLQSRLKVIIIIIIIKQENNEWRIVKN